jgi:hypothetical protein
MASAGRLDAATDSDRDRDRDRDRVELGDDAVHKIVKQLKAAPLTTRRAEGILRPAGLEPTPLSDPGVHEDWSWFSPGTR